MQSHFASLRMNDLDLGESKYNSRENITDKFSPKYRIPGATTGYSGHISEELSVSVSNDNTSPADKFMIRGYTGFRPARREVVGEPSVPNEVKQMAIKRASPRPGSSSSGSHTPSKDSQNSSPRAMSDGGAVANFRAYARQLDMLERYNQATQQLLERGQSQEQLLRIVQSKLSERVNSYAWQQIRTRKLFEANDVNQDGVLDEGEFRICLEKMNIQFDDVQALALFAYFDFNNDGFIEWDEFAENAMVYNPRGGTGVLPKMITCKTTEDISVNNNTIRRSSANARTSPTSSDYDAQHGSPRFSLHK